jgi:CubicO group peptidase (beta-lactamase class C family)
MKSTWRALVVLLVLVALVLSACQPVLPVEQEEAVLPAVSESTLDPALVAEIEAFVEQEMAEQGIPGVSIGIVKDGEVAYVKGFGVADVDSGEPITSQSLFHLASVSKTAVATALLQLVEQGKVDLDDPVVDYLPYFELADERFSQITIRQMLSHTSGMGDVADYEWDNPVFDDAAAERYVHSLSNETLLAAPGEGFHYSSMAFDVLGDLIAKVSGQPFEEYVQEHIFTPLGMENTTFLFEEANPGLLTSPHVLDEEGNVIVSEVFPYNRMHAPSSTLHSNAEDMARYALAHINRGELDGVRILETESYDELWSNVASTGWEEWMGPIMADYGLGWTVGSLGGHDILSHGGADVGYNARLLIAPSESVGLIVMSNIVDQSAGIVPALLISQPLIPQLLGVDSGNETSAEEPAIDPELVAQIDAYIEEMMAGNGLPGFALGVVKDGTLAYAKGFGFANVDAGEPVTPQTIFQVAEVTFAPTAIAVLQLAEQGLIDLDAPVTDYLPYFTMQDEGADRITVRHLLEHTSGVPDSGDTAADWPSMTIETDDGALERFVRGLADTELLFAPGEGWEWSDVGYNILGDVVAKVTGVPFEQYMQESILAPLGMAHSTFLRDEADPKLLAVPHIEDEDGAVLVADVVPYSRQFAASNNLHSNVEDMAQLMVACLNLGEPESGQLLPAESFEEMWAELNETYMADFLFGQLYPTSLFPKTGMGWSVTEIEEHRIVHAYGGERGFQSDMMLCPDMAVGIIAMGNGVAGGAFYSPDTAVDVMGLLMQE